MKPALTFCSVAFTIALLASAISIASSEAARAGTISKPPAAQKRTSESDSAVVGSGEVLRDNFISVRSVVAGRIQKIYVQPGDDISKGQPLFLVEPQSSNQANVTIFSPLTGVVADISIRVGEMTLGTAADTVLMRIADMSRLYVDIFLDRPGFSRVTVGQPATIVVDAFHEARIMGRVVSKDPKPVARSDAPAGEPEFRVRVQMTQVQNYVRRRIRPGMSATASIQVASQSLCKRQPVEDLVNAFAESFSNKTMATLDADRPYAGRFTIRIEHSLADDNDPQRFEIRRFSSFARAEKWFKSREIDGMPGRNTRPLGKCARGVCSYNSEGGILHNNLYLTKITYGIRNGCPYIKTIYLLDGD